MTTNCLQGKTEGFDCWRGTKVKRATREDALHAYSMVLFMLGGIFNATHSRVNDMKAALAEHPKLYRHAVKKTTVQAMECCTQVAATFKWLTEVDDAYQDWMDITDYLEEDIDPQMQRLYWAIDTAVMKTRKEPHAVLTNLTMAYNLAILAKDVADGLEKLLREEIDGRMRMPQRLMSPIHGLVSYLENLYATVVPEETYEEVKGYPPVRDGIVIVFRYFIDMRNVERMAVKKVEDYGISDNVRPGDTDAQRNKGGRWNGPQDRILKLHYGLMPDEDLAATLGRTVGAIAARARVLGVDKNSSYEERLVREKEEYDKEHFKTKES